MLFLNMKGIKHRQAKFEKPTKQKQTTIQTHTESAPIFASSTVFLRLWALNVLIETRRSQWSQNLLFFHFEQYTIFSFTGKTVSTSNANVTERLACSWKKGLVTKLTQPLHGYLLVLRRDFSVHEVRWFRLSLSTYANSSAVQIVFIHQISKTWIRLPAQKVAVVHQAIFIQCQELHPLIVVRVRE